MPAPSPRHRSGLVAALVALTLLGAPALFPAAAAAEQQTAATEATGTTTTEPAAPAEGTTTGAPDPEQPTTTTSATGTSTDTTSPSVTRSPTTTRAGTGPVTSTTTRAGTATTPAGRTTSGDPTPETSTRTGDPDAEGDEGDEGDEAAGALPMCVEDPGGSPLSCGSCGCGRVLALTEQIVVNSPGSYVFNPAEHISIPYSDYYVYVDAPPIHASATVSGGRITVSPLTGVRGVCDSFSYHVEPAIVIGSRPDDGPLVLRSSAPALGPTPLAAADWPGGTVQLVIDGITPAADTAYTSEPRPVTIDVTANDGVGSRSVVVTPSAPANGSVSVSGGRVTYRPDAGFSGTDSFRYDLALGCNPSVSLGSATVTVLVGAGARNDTAVTWNGDPVTIPVTANDENGDAYQVTITRPPSDGTAEVEGRSVRYDPRTGFAGRDSFDYALTNDGVVDDEATVTVDVGRIWNDRPQVWPTHLSTALDVLENDVVPEGWSLQVSRQPARGSVAVEGTHLRYEHPIGGLTEPVTLGYVLTDGEGGRSPEATVTVRPLAVVNDDATTPFGEPVDISVLANDIGMPDNAFIEIVDDGYWHLGSAEVVGDRIRYTPGPGCSFGYDRFTYRVMAWPFEGPAYEVGTAEVRVQVQAPVLPDLSATGVTGLPVTVDLAGGDEDLRACDLIVLNGPSNGVAEANDESVATYASDPAFAGTDSFTYGIPESEGWTPASGTVTVRIEALRAVADEVVGAPGRDVVVPVTANDDVPPGFAPQIDRHPLRGTATLAGDDIVYRSEPDSTRQDTFTYRLLDEAGQGSPAAPVTVHLLDALDDRADSVRGLPIDLTVLANDVFDGAPLPGALGDPLLGGLVVEPSGAVTGGRVTRTGPATFRFTPDGAFTGTARFGYQLRLGDRVIDTAQVRVTVPARPDAVADRASTDRDRAVTIPVLGNDRNVAGLTVVVTARPSDGRVSVVGGSVRYQPRRGFTGRDRFTYGVTDGFRVFDTAPVDVRVVPPESDTPDPETTPRSTPTGRSTPTAPPGDPTATTPPEEPEAPEARDDVGETGPGVPIVIDVVANDLGDIDPGTVEIVDPPAHGTVVINANGTLTYTSGEGTGGLTDSFTYRVADRSGLIDSATVVVRLVPLIDLDVPPGGPEDTITVRGTGCQAGDSVRIWVNGVYASTVRADAGGTFVADLSRPTGIGRHEFRAACGSRTFQGPLDVVQLVSAGTSGAGSAAAAVALMVGGVLCFYLLSGLLLASQNNPQARHRY